TMSRSYRRLLSLYGRYGVTGSVTDLATDQNQKQQTEHKIEVDEADQSEHRVAAADYSAIAVRRVKETVDQPGLASQLRRHPPQRVGEVGKWEREHQHPEQPAAGFQSAAQILDSGIGHQDDKNRPERDHEVKGVIEQLDVVGPRLPGKVVQSVDIASKVAVGEKAEGTRDLDRVVEPPGRNVRLSDHRDAGPGTALESALHGRQGHRLVIANHLDLLVAGRERNKNGGNQPDDSSSAQVHSRLLQMESAQGVECAYGRHHERARDQRRHLIVAELNPGPWIEQVSTETGNAQRAIRFDVV